MHKHAVIFMLICVLMAACLSTGCAGSTSQGSAPSSQGASASNDSNDSAVNSPVAPASPSQDVPGSNETSNGSAMTGQNTPSPAAQAIPDSNESAVSDWGTVAPEDRTAAKGTANSSGTEIAGNGSTAPGAASAFQQVLVDREDLYFAIRDVKDDCALGYTWQVYVENRTDKNLMFSFERVAVNGVMCDPYWAEVIAAGKKGNCEIVWLRDSLDQRQITDVRKVEFTLNVYNDDIYTEAPLMHDAFTVYPLGQDDSADKNIVRKLTLADQILVDNRDCTILVTGFEPDNSWGYVMNLYLVNKTDQDLVFNVDDSWINDNPCFTYWTEIVTAGNAAYSSILWEKADLEESEIQVVRKISLPMLVYSDQETEEALIDETFKIKP